MFAGLGDDVSSGIQSYVGRLVWRRLDGAVLVSNLVSGVLWLLLTTFLWGGLGVLSLGPIGAAYVVVCSVFFAAVYASETLSRRQELLTWLAPWIAAWLLVFLGVLSDHELGDVGWASAVAISVVLGVMVGIPYVLWQVAALVIRQLMAWRAGQSTLPTEGEWSAGRNQGDRG
ncbi:hypothetical protein [Nocardioides sp. Iso805N]|uniref:hypothetical protein n=1 Tax=Nocardioides sp. Iso805N TaxID=1283287 RepID=UPI00037D1129|nr:hypothetical protein [Nocardioides sp. Iso805N]